MRLVVDTNVFISAALKDSSWPAHTIRWLSKYDGLLKSTAVEDELFAVLRRPRFADKITPVFLEEVGESSLLQSGSLSPSASRYVATRTTTSSSSSLSTAVPI